MLKGLVFRIILELRKSNLTKQLQLNIQLMPYCLSGIFNDITQFTVFLDVESEKLRKGLSILQCNAVVDIFL